MIGMKCPNCGKVHLNTQDHLEANWDQTFACDPGCGIQMKLDREEAQSILDQASADHPAIIPMHEVS
jgi:hypothetical protein